MAVRVLAEYVTLKVASPVAGVHYRGYLKDSIVDEVEESSLKHHLDLGMVEMIPDEPEPEPDPDADPAPDPDPAVPDDQPPAGNASREVWAAYAATKGASEEETKPIEEGGLKQTELRELYG